MNAPGTEEMARAADRQRSAAAPAETSDETLYEVRRKIYPRSVTGAFSSWRVWLVLFTQLIYYGTPWLQWNGRQAVLFDLGERKFYIFGLVLWPQDVIYLAVLLVISALALFLFTAIAGRLFCGYACPQTVYTEIFMWIERRIEGDRIARIRLDGDPWSLRKLRIKATKHFLWVLIALWLGHQNATTTHIYLHADMSIKERALARIPTPGTPPGRYQPADDLINFLERL